MVIFVFDKNRLARSPLELFRVVEERFLLRLIELPVEVH